MDGMQNKTIINQLLLKDKCVLMTCMASPTVTILLSMIDIYIIYILSLTHTHISL